MEFNKLIMWILALAILIVFSIAFFIVSHSIEVKRTFPADDLSLALNVHSDQCERPANNQFVVETQNTWSNLAYILAGILILLRSRSWPGCLFGANLILIGITSGLYHATLGHEPQILDVAWIYGVLFSAILYASYVLWNSEQYFPVRWWAWFVVGGLHVVALGAALLLSDHTMAAIASFVLISIILVPGIEASIFRWTRSGELVPVPWWAWLVMTVVLTLFGYVMRKTFTPVFNWDSDALFPIFFGSLASLVVLAVLARMKLSDESWNAWFWIELGVIGVVLVGGIVAKLQEGYNLDAAHHVATRKALCFPDGWLQPHALWHVLSAAALLFAYDLLAQIDRSGRNEAVDRPAIFPEL